MKSYSAKFVQILSILPRMVLTIYCRVGGTERARTAEGESMGYGI